VRTEFGQFTWDGGAWVSEPIATPVFGDAPLHIQVFGSDADVTLLTEQEAEVLRRFFSLPRSHAEEIVPHLWQYYRELWDSVGAPDIIEIPDGADIWRHVQPRFVGVEERNDGLLYVSVEGECDWEVEHGLQLVLQRGERWVKVSSFTGHLTDGDSYGRSALDDWMADPSAKLPRRSLADKLAVRPDRRHSS
jgi:hypothetical protein